MLCAVVWRGGSGRLWTFTGMLTLLAAGELDWYGLTHGWQTAHRHVGLLLIPAAVIGLPQRRPGPVTAGLTASAFRDRAVSQENPVTMAVRWNSPA